MTKITRTGYTKKQARAIIDAFYESDKSSSFSDKLHNTLHGKCVNVAIERFPYGGGWQLYATSAVWGDVTMHSIIDQALNVELNPKPFNE